MWFGGALQIGILPYSRGITCSFAHLSNNERVEATALTVSLRPHSVRLHSAELQSATAVRLYMRPLRLTKTRPRRLSKLECHSSVVTSGSGLAVISLHFHILDLFHSLSCWMNARVLRFSFFFCHCFCLNWLYWNWNVTVVQMVPEQKYKNAWISWSPLSRVFDAETDIRRIREPP